ncbi:hypothetical protein [Prolixibacter denitrificans]|nr:hypothetical protein [Prolixibacter denitrificans]PSK81434.1 hypothetical protein CLV93_10937 [Prolixibacter denitrificans]
MSDYQFSIFFVAFVAIIFTIFISWIDGRIEINQKRSNIVYYYVLGLIFSLLPIYYIVHPSLYVFYYSLRSARDIEPNDVIDLISYVVSFLGYVIIGYVLNRRRHYIKHKIEEDQKKSLRYLLLPFTMIGWYLMSYYGVKLFVKLTMIAFEMLPGGIALMIIFGFLSMLAFVFIYFIAVGLPTLLDKLIRSLYGMKWFSVIAHCFMGFLGIYSILSEYAHHPPQMMDAQDNMQVMFLRYMWETAPIRTILVVLPFLALLIYFMYITNIYLFILKKNKNL